MKAWIVFLLLWSTVSPEEIFQRVGLVRNGQAGRLEVLVNIDDEVGRYSILRFEFWGRGRGSTWINVGIDELKQLRNLTSKAASSKGYWGVNAEKLGKSRVEMGEIVVELVSTPTGNSVVWKYVSDLDESGFSFPLNQAQAKALTERIGSAIDMLAKSMKTTK